MAIKDLFYIESLGQLYIDVQLNEVFPDSKFFVDCIPLADPASILQAYESEKKQTSFNLKKFVIKWFALPPETDTKYQSANKPIEYHLNELWSVLQRAPSAKGGTLIPLPFPYIVPGGRFREIYYWDSYFTLLGLQQSGRIDIMQNMVDNFAYLINEIGFIPNGNRTYYTGRSQPPFFTLMVELLGENKNEDILLHYLPQIEKEYKFWMDDNQKPASANSWRRLVQMPDGSMLNRYWDDNSGPRPEAYTEDMHIATTSKRNMQEVFRHIRAAAESGWDFSSRWFKDINTMASIQTTDLIPVDLNCLLLHMEETLLKIYTGQKETVLITAFTEKVNQRKNAIQRYCWNEDRGFYFDYNFTDNKQTGLYTLAALYPLFFSVCEPAQAKRVADVIEDKFLKPGGLLTTIYKTGQQWDAPNGWAPLQWTTYKGLLNYGFSSLAEEVKQNWMQMNKSVYNATGKMMEKYNVLDVASGAGGGEYPNQDGFGWTNGVYLKLNS